MPQVPQIGSAAPDVRSQAPASQRNEPTDGFSQLLNSVGSDTQTDEPQSRDTDSVQAKPVKNDRADRTDRRDDSDQTDKTDKTDPKKNTSDADSADSAPVKGKSDKDASGDSGKSKDHKDGKKDTADAASDLAAASQPVPDKAPSADASVVEAAVVPAQAVKADAAPETPAPPADTTTPAIDAASQAADTKNANGVAAQAGIAAQAALDTGKARGKATASTKADATANFETAAAKGETKSADEKPVQVAANTTAAAAAPKAQPIAPAQPNQPNQPSQPNEQAKQVSPDANALAANVTADTSAKKTDTPAPSQQDSADNSLAKQLSADLHLNNTSQIVLPDTTRGMQVNPTANLVTQANVTAAGSQPVPFTNGAIAVEIAARAKDGVRQFDIRLDPPELGRIDVKLDVDKDGTVNTRLTVDRPETLNLLQRDSQGLERALQQAGLKTSDGGMEFSLRQQTPDGSMSGRNQAQPQPQSNGNAGNSLAANGDLTTTIQADQYQWAARMRGGVDIRI